MTKKVDVPITVTFRHLAPTDSLKNHAEKKLSNIIGLIPGATDVHVILSTATHHHRQSAEFVVHASSSHLTAHAETDDMYASIDQAAAKLDSQVRKLKGRVVESSRKRTSSARRPMPPAASAGDE
ncbi:MAG: ribosome-associated translation inhibitor RaiA [Candidatus Binatia bacterium]|nr:ribosome-associated translation inhibitor RaiA [Candidatus Binatia bacterium]